MHEDDALALALTCRALRDALWARFPRTGRKSLPDQCSPDMDPAHVDGDKLAYRRQTSVGPAPLGEDWFDDERLVGRRLRTRCRAVVKTAARLAWVGITRGRHWHSALVPTARRESLYRTERTATKTSAEWPRLPRTGEPHARAAGVAARQPR